jgi:hypothetical protein
MLGTLLKIQIILFCNFVFTQRTKQGRQCPEKKTMKDLSLAGRNSSMQIVRPEGKLKEGSCAMRCNGKSETALTTPLFPELKILHKMSNLDILES